ncbi:hypothetical protein BpHYR1_023763 [Brachionus plicatilis]|uniref:Uncharacterized protein n=1 Tax=Brachionus plicatilis TaxID=10195 RepID=A0A3M7SMW8_BRAPC|nr:hypothetical protein BpHYR1_023763 [Brachionus plicatilis]
MSLSRCLTYGAWETTRDFSRRYSCNWAPITRPFFVNIMSKYLPKRDELSFITVFALPNASINGKFIKRTEPFYFLDILFLQQVSQPKSKITKILQNEDKNNDDFFWKFKKKIVTYATQDSKLLKK